MKIEYSPKGFSLVETIVYVAIFSVLAGALVLFSSSLVSTRLHSQAVLEVNDQGSSAIKTITQKLRDASSVNSPTIGNMASSLSLVTYSPVKNPTAFSENGGVLYITEGSGSPVALTNNKVVVSNLIFSNFSRPNTPGIINVSFTITSINANNQYAVSFDGSGALRK
jgi:type II secretory pathway pseudopilin PulG